MRQEAKAAKPARNLDELLAGLPKASPEVEARVKAEIAERELAASEAKKVKPTDKTKGKAAIAEMKRILMTPEERAASEAQLREQRLQSFLEPSAIKERLYHGTGEDIREFDPSLAYEDVEATFLTKNPKAASIFGKTKADMIEYDPNEIAAGANVMPVHVQVTNPFDYENPDHRETLKQLAQSVYPKDSHVLNRIDNFGRLENNWSLIEDPKIQDLIQSAGFDAFYVSEAGQKNLGVYDPRRIKSAIGNRGTYDITDPDITKAEGGLAMQAGGVPTFMKLIKKLATDIKKAEKAGDLETSLAKRKELNKAIQSGVNDPLMPRAQPLTQAEIRMYAERMAPQVAGELTRGADAKTVAGKSQKQFKREQTLPVDRAVLPGAVDPSAPLPYMTLEDQIDSVLLGLPGDPTLARVSLAGIGDVPFAQAVTQHGGPRYGDENKLWASNLSAATGLLNAADRASRQFGDAPVIASYMKMPSGFGFAQHYLETLLQYQRPDLLNKAAREALEKDIKAGFVDDGKRVTFPNFPGFDDLGAVAQAAEGDSILRKHIAAKLGTSEKYGLRPAADVQFAVSHPELTNLETGASGFTLGELHAKPLALSSHPTYEYDILGKVLGQTQYPTPYDLMYRDQLELIRNNPEAPEFNTLKMLGARQKIDEQLVNEINEYQERMRQLLGRKKGGAVEEAEGGLAPYGLRHSGEGVKGKGYFGLLPNKMDGVSTEISVEDETGEYPLIVPTLTAEELDRLLAGKDPTAEMMEKASSWAATRRKRGESPFASPTEVRMPRPKAEGGPVNLTDLPDEVTPANWREHLQNNVLADARALLGVKDGGVINLDELIEKSLKKKDGGVINLDDLIDWTLAKAEHRKMKEGGAVKMQGGGNPGEVSGEMFKPKPLTIPEPITDLVEALRRQFEKEKRSMRKPGAVQDVLMRGPVAAYAGAPADIVGMGGELLDYVQKKIPALRKPASVMDTGPEKTPPMGYAPAFPLSPEGSYGTTAAQELLGKAGLTTGEERPLFETGAMVAAPVAGYAGFKAGKALAPTAKEMLDVQLQQMMSPYQMNVIKSEGGNWVRGATQKYVEPLKRREAGGRFSEDVLKELEERYTPEALATFDPETRAFVEQTTFPVAQANAAINRFVDKKLAKYIQNELGTPSDSVRIQADAWAEKQKTLLADKQKQIDKVRSDIEKARQERNVDPEMLTRSQARLRELQKEKDLIKNRRGLHFNIVDADIRGEAARVMRAEQGLPEVNTAKSPIGKLWEDTSDYTIRRGPYHEQIPFQAFDEMASVPRPERLAKMAEINKAELEKLGGEFAVQNPAELAYSLNRGMPARLLGFEHLTDELVNALHFNDLPEYLRLTPKTLDKMSVPQVVEHVDKINAWRASQKAEVDKARAANAATVVHKEYPEQGLKWVELKLVTPEQFDLPKGFSMIEDPSRNKAGEIVKTGYRLQSPEGKLLSYGETPADAYAQHFGKEALEDALKYEGEILQHCVGGYCPDVVEGRSRIFSLRDADGRPHATIEVEPSGYRDVFRNLPLEQKNEINAALEKWSSNIDYTPNSEELVAKTEQVMAQLGYKPTERISQIKGLQNKKPEAEFIPYIQDFVKGGDWHSVGDLGHTELFRITPGQKLPGFAKEIEPGFYTLEDFKKMAVENEMPQEILDNWMTKLQDFHRYGYAKGGGVKRRNGVTKADLEREYRMAFGGGVFNTDPDITDSGRIIPHNI